MRGIHRHLQRAFLSQSSHHDSHPVRLPIEIMIELPIVQVSVQIQDRYTIFQLVPNEASHGIKKFGVTGSRIGVCKNDGGNAVLANQTLGPIGLATKPLFPFARCVVFTTHNVESNKE